jgi:uncharacterized YigZ family protein
MEVLSDTFLSVHGESQGIYREKASKFLAFAIPVINEAEVKQTLDRLRKEHHGANHFCYAYRLGFDKTHYRMNDDGEPSGSAGKPIYGQLLSFDLSDVLVVVVRYFGGTKLGIPGLINAYRTATRESLSKARIIEKTVTVRIQVSFNYPAMNDIMRIMKEKDCQILKQTYDEQCKIDFSVRKSKEKNTLEKIYNLNNPHIFIQVHDMD